MIDQDLLGMTLLAMEMQIDKGGWDQPHYLYAINADQTFERVVTLQGHPTDQLITLFEYDRTFKDKPEVIGLVLCLEGWRHLFGTELREIAKGDPKTRELIESLKQAGEVLDLSQERQDEILDEAYNDLISNRDPTSMPLPFRKEVRTLATIMRDRSPVTQAGRSRGDEAPVVQGGIPFEMFMGGGVPQAMWAVLTGEKWDG